MVKLLSSSRPAQVSGAGLPGTACGRTARPRQNHRTAALGRTAGSSSPAPLNPAKQKQSCPKKNISVASAPGAYYRATKPIDKLRAGTSFCCGPRKGRYMDSLATKASTTTRGVCRPLHPGAGGTIRTPQADRDHFNRSQRGENVTPDVLQLPLSVEQGPTQKRRL